MKRLFVFSISFVLTFFFLAGCSSFVQDIKTISNKKEYTVSFFAPGCEGEMKSIKAQYQETITLPDCAFKNPDVSQIFAGWTIGANEVQVFYPDDGKIEVTENLSLYAKWMDKDLTRYKVIHLFQDIDDVNAYTQNEKLAEDKTGYYGAYTEAEPLNVFGFTAEPIEQIIIERDANPIQVVQIKYNRNKYTISFEADEDCKIDPIEAPYQKTIEIPKCDCDKHESMKFAGWSYVDSSTNEIAYIAGEHIKVTDDMHLYAQWESWGTSEYKVRHFFQNINDNGYTEFPEYPHQIFEGTKGVQTNAQPHEVTGFKAKDFNQKEILEDNGLGPNTIVDIYYDRILVTLTFNLDDGTMTSPGLSEGNKLVLKYGANVPVPVVEKEGYIFTSWTPALPAVAEANGSYTATWEHSYNYIPGTDGGLVGTPTVEQGSVAKPYISFGDDEEIKIENTAEIYVVPKGTVARINTDGSLIWYPDGLEKNEEIHVHGAFHHNRKVELSPYIISKYPVTTELYKYVMKNVKDANPDPSDYSKSPMKPFESNPVNNVTWYDAVLFCNKLSAMQGLEPVYYIYENGKNVYEIEDWPIKEPETFKKIRGDHTRNGYRLPTNAEWEFAARGGNPSQEDWKYAFSGVNLVSGKKLHTNYQVDENLDTVAYYKGNTNQKGPCNVGKKKGNRLGLYDMSGGICEWTYDFMNEDFSFDDTPYLVGDIVVNPMGTEKGTLHSLRGGSYFSSAFYCTVTYILSKTSDTSATNKKYSYGFRLCRSAK